MAHYPFIGPGYTLASVAADCQRLVNWYLEPNETGQGRSRLVLKRRPGLSLFCDLTAVGNPCRGVWAGENRLFAVVGPKLVEVFADQTYNVRGDVGTDGLPVRIAANGNQLLITSAGAVYCDNGAGPVQVSFNAGSGTVDTNGQAVTWDSGSQFFNVSANDLITINGTVYQVKTATDNTDLVLYFSAGVQNGVPWSAFGLNGVIRIIENIIGGYSTINLLSGDPFPPNIATVTTTGGVFTVTQWLSPTQLKIPVAPGSPPLQYGSDVPIAAEQCTFIDTYFVIFPPASNAFFISAPFDGTTWDASDSAQKEGYPDHIAAIIADHEQLWLLGDENSGEVWLDTGAALFPFQRDPSRTIHWGCRATWSLVRFGNGVAWIGGDQERGGPFVFASEGSTPIRISTFAIEQAWAQYATVSDAVVYVRVIDGHEILVVNFPTANVTWGYDRTVSQLLQMPVWFEMAWWNGASLDRDRGAFHAAVSLAAHGLVAQLPNQSFLGDWQTGKIYTSNPTMVNDAGVPIHRIRTASHLAGQDNLRLFGFRFEVLADLGPPVTGGPPATTPGSISPVLDYSRDGGHTFVNPQTRTAPPAVNAATGIGVTNPWLSRLLWWRQGAPRDKVVRLTMTDQTQFTILDAFFESEQGAS